MEIEVITFGFEWLMKNAIAVQSVRPWSPFHFLACLFLAIQRGHPVDDEREVGNP